MLVFMVLYMVDVTGFFACLVALSRGGKPMETLEDMAGLVRERPGIALVMTPYALYRDGRDVIPAMRTYWRRGFTGGALQVLSYSTALWAMTLAPIAIVATLRETSVLFGAAIAVIVLNEPLRLPRVGAALLILCGLIMLRLQ